MCVVKPGYVGPFPTWMMSGIKFILVLTGLHENELREERIHKSHISTCFILKDSSKSDLLPTCASSIMTETYIKTVFLLSGERPQIDHIDSI